MKVTKEKIESVLTLIEERGNACYYLNPLTNKKFSVFYKENDSNLVDFISWVDEFWSGITWVSQRERLQVSYIGYDWDYVKSKISE